jgi:hypothetical protein
VKALVMVVQVRSMGRVYSLPAWQHGPRPVLGATYHFGWEDTAGLVFGGWLGKRRLFWATAWLEKDGD